MVIPLPSDPIKIMPKRIGRSVRVYFTRLPWLRNGIYGGYVYVNIYIYMYIYIYIYISITIYHDLQSDGFIAYT